MTFNSYDRDEDALLTASRVQRICMFGILVTVDEDITYDQATKIRRDHAYMCSTMAPLQERAEAEGWD